MLSESTVERLVSPIIIRQEAINTYVLEKIANGVREIGTLSSADVRHLKLLVTWGADIRQMNEELAKLSNVQVREIKSLIKTAAVTAHLDAKPLYDYRHKSFIPYEKNTSLQNIVTSVGNRTAQTYQNIANSQATGFLVRDLQNPGKLKFQSIGDTYNSVMDEAIQAVKSGVDYRTVMRRTLKQLADSGIRRLYWQSGYTQRLDTAVRRNLLEGVRAIDQGVEDLIGAEINADGKELSAHANCAPDHEPFQGHQFTNENFSRLQSNDDFEDVNHTSFSGVDRVIGQYNCRHVARSIIIGVTKPRYTAAQLQKFINDNAQGYTLPNGKHLSLYECTQMQRQLETRIRYAKDEQIALLNAGDRQGAEIAQQKVRRLVNEYKQFSSDCGLRAQMSRAAIAGYHAIKIH